jgi:hypothetical protein
MDAATHGEVDAAFFRTHVQPKPTQARHVFSELFERHGGDESG